MARGLFDLAHGEPTAEGASAACAIAESMFRISKDLPAIIEIMTAWINTQSNG